MSEKVDLKGCSFVITEDKIYLNNGSFNTELNQITKDFLLNDFSVSAKKLKKGMGRNKGASFELDVSKKLSVWWYGVKKAIRRTPMSGGWSKTMAAGDLICEFEDSWPFSIECKHNKSWSFNELFLDGLGMIGKFWSQCVNESPKNKIPVLVFRGNYGKTYVLIKKSDMVISESILNGKIVSLKDQFNEPVLIFMFDLLLKLDPIKMLKDVVFNTKITPEKLEQDRKSAEQKFKSDE